MEKIDNLNYSCFDEDSSEEIGMLNEYSEEKAPVHEPICVKPIADASASVLNGPNGAEVCKTIRYTVSVAGGVISFWMLLEFIGRFKSAA